MLLTWFMLSSICLCLGMCKEAIILRWSKIMLDMLNPKNEHFKNIFFETRLSL